MDCISLEGMIPIYPFIGLWLLHSVGLLYLPTLGIKQPFPSTWFFTLFQPWEIWDFEREGDHSIQRKSQIFRGGRYHLLGSCSFPFLAIFELDFLYHIILWPLTSWELVSDGISFFAVSLFSDEFSHLLSFPFVFRSFVLPRECYQVSKVFMLQNLLLLRMWNKQKDVFELMITMTAWWLLVNFQQDIQKCSIMLFLTRMFMFSGPSQIKPFRKMGSSQ